MVFHAPDVNVQRADKHILKQEEAEKERLRALAVRLREKRTAARRKRTGIDLGEEITKRPEGGEEKICTERAGEDLRVQIKDIVDTQTEANMKRIAGEHESFGRSREEGHA